MFESHRSPLVTPVTTEKVASPVTITMSPTTNQLSGSTQPRYSRPAEICCTPKPSDVATPNRVPTIAIASMACPIGPSTRLRPSSGSSSQRIDSGRPLR